MTRSILFAGAWLLASAMASLPAGDEAKATPEEAERQRILARFMLFQQPRVQQELKVTPDQKAKFRELEKTNRPKFPDLRKVSEDERKKFLAEVNEGRQKAVAEAVKGLDRILTPAQSKRFDQLSLQSRGTKALEDDGVARTLKLTADQRKKIAEVFVALDEQDKQDRVTTAEKKEISPGETYGKLMERKAERRKEAETAIAAVLSKTQLEAFEGMKGAPFEFNPAPKPAVSSSPGVAEGDAAREASQKRTKDVIPEVEKAAGKAAEKSSKATGKETEKAAGKAGEKNAGKAGHEETDEAPAKGGRS